MKQALIAFTVSPLIGALVFLGGVDAIQAFIEYKKTCDPCFAGAFLVVGSLIAIPFAYIMTLLIPVPLYFILKLLGWLNRWTFFLLGIISSLIIAWISVRVRPVSEVDPQVSKDDLIFMIGVFLCGILSTAIAQRVLKIGEAHKNKMDPTSKLAAH